MFLSRFPRPLCEPLATPPPTYPHVASPFPGRWATQPPEHTNAWCTFPLAAPLTMQTSHILPLKTSCHLSSPLSITPDGRISCWPGTSMPARHAPMAVHPPLDFTNPATYIPALPPDLCQPLSPCIPPHTNLNSEPANAAINVFLSLLWEHALAVMAALPATRLASPR